MEKGKKIIRGILKGIGIVFGLLVIIFVISRYGWRLFGYDLCDSPNTVWVEDVTVNGDEITIDGGTGDSISSFVGYKYEIKDGNLYIGVKHNLLGGFFNRIGGFHVTIHEDASKIENIYLRNGKDERLVWNMKDGRVK